MSIRAHRPWRRRVVGSGAQCGIGLPGILILLALAVFFVALLVKMGPAYMTYFQVRAMMDRVMEKPDLQGAGTRQILSAMSRQLSIDGIRTVEQSDFAVKREGSEVYLVLDYQAQTHLGFNVDVLMHFTHRTPFPPRS